MQNDPHWITARFNYGRCPRCQHEHRKGERLFYYPIGKAAYCQPCGEEVHREFKGMCADEHFYNAH